MDLAVHEIAKCLINHLMTLYRILSGKRIGDDGEKKMPRATCLGMSCMGGTGIHQFDVDRLQGFLQPAFDQLYSVSHWGNT